MVSFLLQNSFILCTFFNVNIKFLNNIFLYTNSILKRKIYIIVWSAFFHLSIDL